MRSLPPLALILSLALISACGGDKDHKDHAHKGDSHKDHKHKDHKHDEGGGHAHAPQHGGTLIELGDHFANAEILITKEGKLSLWVLDAHAENHVRIAQPEVQLTLLTSKLGTKEKPIADTSFTLKAVANVNTGEKAGDTSQFDSESSLESLTTAKEVSGTIKTITVKGQTFSDVKFTLERK